MTNGERLSTLSPGLSTAWKFWRAIENGDISAAQSHFEVVNALRSIDEGTKQEISAALRTLEEDTSARQKYVSLQVTSDSEDRATPVPAKEQHESPVRDQERALETILDLLRESKLTEALHTFTSLPYQVDKARVLCSLISHKTGRRQSVKSSKDTHGHELQRPDERDSIASVVPAPQRPAVIAAFFEAYYTTAVSNSDKTKLAGN